MSDRKAPAFQFFPGDWRRDTALQTCSLAARGLWVECLGLMHDGDPYGHLAVAGRAIAPEVLARMVGETAAVTRKLLKELEDAGVPSRTADGILYSRRMVRDERVRRARAEGGRQSILHPTVAARMKDAPKGAGKDWAKDTLDGPLPPSPASASAFASARSATAAKPRPQTFGRITLHRWQIDELIEALGPNADGFRLDEWIAGLSALADARRLVFTDRNESWKWVRAELAAECERRGLQAAKPEARAIAPPAPRGCRHEPRCTDEATHTRKYLREQREAAS